MKVLEFAALAAEQAAATEERSRPLAERDHEAQGSGPWPVRLTAWASGAGSFLLALRGRNRSSYEYDEGVTVHSFVNAPLGHPFTAQVVANNHPIFSFLEQLVWRLGGTTEAAMRLPPALCGAGAVGLMASWCGRRWGIAAAVAGALVLATNPMFVDASRQARGYSLMTLVAVASTILVLRTLDGPAELAPPRWLGPAYVVLTAAGLGTHLYTGLVLAAHLGLIVARGRLSMAWVIRWLGAGALAAVVYLETFPVRREGVFDPGFPATAARQLLGGHVVAVVVLGVVVCAGVVALRRDALAVAIPIGIVAVIWAVVHPFDLYPRFLVVGVPGVAVAAAWAAGNRRAAVVPLVVVAAAVVPLTAPDWGARDAAAQLEALVGDDGVACAVGSEALMVYTDVVEYRPERRCDAIAVAGSWEPDGLATERARRPLELTAGSIEVLGPIED